jgi:hypothetical protein
MKNLYLLFTFFYLSVNTSAQNKILIKFKNGTEIEGYGRIMLDDNILYREKKGAEKKIYNYMTVRKLIVFNEDSRNHYEYKVAGAVGYEDFKLFKIVKTGKITLYEEVFNGRTNPGTMGGLNMSYSSVNYYISKVGSNRVTNLREGNTYSKRFRKKIALKYFSDCSDLMDKINTREFFNRYGIESVVDYYNEKCE